MEPKTPTKSQYRWWRDPRWIIAMLVAATVGLVLWGLFGPEPKLIASRETTFITEPLRPDGTPDYAAHVLDLLGRGAPPEENAAVAVLQATWPMGLDDDDLAAVCKALGIPNTPPDVLPLASADHDTGLRVELRAFLELNACDGGIARYSDEDANGRVFTLIDSARASPWTSEECPPLAAWIERRSPAFDLVVEGASRPTYELPLPDLLRREPGAMLIGVIVQDLSSLRAACQGLILRAMLYLGEGQVTDAWRDIHAVHRLTRLIAPAGRPRFLVLHLMARALHATANAATVTLLESPHLTEAMAASIRHDLDALPPLPEIGSSQVMERLGVVDIVVGIARMPRAERANLWSSVVGDDLAWLVSTSLDMNVVLRAINANADRMAAAVALPSHAERCRAVDQINADLASPACGPGALAKAGWFAQLATNRGARSNAFARNLMSMLVSTSRGILDGYERGRADAAVVLLASALAEYRTRGLGGEGKPYPNSLQDLVPAVLATVPDDPCSGKPFRYERRGDGYLLYSVGPDGTDDGGTNEEISGGEWRSDDDVPGPLKSRDMVVRLPRPSRSLVPPVNDVTE